MGLPLYKKTKDVFFQVCMDNNTKQAQDNKLDVRILHKNNASLSKSKKGPKLEQVKRNPVI